MMMLLFVRRNSINKITTVILIVSSTSKLYDPIKQLNWLHFQLYLLSSKQISSDEYHDI